jgi:hypothetical protein
MKRKPAVAGTFYEDSAIALKAQIGAFTDLKASKERILGAVAPHAGYVYSGHVAGAVYSRIEPADTFIILGPNHTGLGAKAAIFAKGAWELPMGEVEIDEGLGQELLEISREFTPDDVAHLSEHSIEVQIPFLQFFFRNFKILPICLGRLDLKKCLAIGRAIAGIIKGKKKNIVIIASSDMSHYVPSETAKKKDRLALDAIEARNPVQLYETVMEKNISMCGVIPTVCMLEACNELGAQEAFLVKYATSGDVSRDYRQVVGYAGLIVR